MVLEDGDGFEGGFDGRIVLDTHRFQVADFVERAEEGASRAGRQVVGHVHGDPGRAGQGDGVDIDHDAVVAIGLDGPDKALGDGPAVPAEAAHGHPVLAGRQHEIVQHDRHMVRPFPPQRRQDPLPSVHGRPPSVLPAPAAPPEKPIRSRTTSGRLPVRTGGPHVPTPQET
jgi:hypothetical protein